MDEGAVLRQITNLSLANRIPNDKTIVDEEIPVQSEQLIRPALEQLIQISHRDIDFGICLPGSIHQKTLKIALKQELEELSELGIFIVCEDQALYDSSSLIFGVKRQGQQQYYDDYRMKIKTKRQYEFKVGVKTPLYYEYNVECVLYIHFLDYAPLAVTLRQRVQTPQIVCSKQLYFQSDRMVKLSVIQGRGKKECRVPFKLNHNMVISVTAEMIGVQQQRLPVIDVKPRSMTLSGKGQFSLIFTMNSDEEMKQKLSHGAVCTVRRVLILRIKETRFIYHFPIQAIYYPQTKKDTEGLMQQA